MDPEGLEGADRRGPLSEDRRRHDDIDAAMARVMEELVDRSILVVLR